MGNPRIEFVERSDGQVEMIFIGVGSMLAEANQAAFALAKRGYSKRELDKHPKWPGMFQFTMEDS